MNSSFLGLDTTLMYPYRDPKFFPNSTLPKSTHRHSVPSVPHTPHPFLNRNQTFSHPNSEMRISNGPDNHSKPIICLKSFRV